MAQATDWSPFPAETGPNGNMNGHADEDVQMGNSEAAGSNQAAFTANGEVCLLSLWQEIHTYPSNSLSWLTHPHLPAQLTFRSRHHNPLQAHHDFLTGKTILLQTYLIHNRQ